MTERDAAIRVLCRCAETAPDASDLHESVAAVRDWDALIDLAVHHGVIGLAARTLANLDGALPSGAARRFEEQRRSLQRRGLAAAAETVRLLRVLGDAGVEALPLKGPSLAAQAYGDTGARDYGDIDLLVHRRDLERARVALTRDRYAPPPEWNPRDERWYQRTLDQARDRFLNGVTNNLEVIEAQQDVAAANENYISSLFAHSLAKLTLLRAMGSAQKDVNKYLGGN